MVQESNGPRTPVDRQCLCVSRAVWVNTHTPQERMRAHAGHDEKRVFTYKLRLAKNARTRWADERPFIACRYLELDHEARPPEPARRRRDQ